MTAQLKLFATTEDALPQGFRYASDIISEEQEVQVVEFIRRLPLQPFVFAGGFIGNRRVKSFGSTYDYNQQKLVDADPVPPELHGLRQAAARFSHHDENNLQQALVTEYAEGAGIGWHRDKRMFGDVIGISLLAPCKFRLRLKNDEGKWNRGSLNVEPRSAYLLSGPSRTEWEHSIPPMDQLRYSVTFRTFAS